LFGQYSTHRGLPVLAQPSHLSGKTVGNQICAEFAMSFHLDWREKGLIMGFGFFVLVFGIVLLGRFGRLGCCSIGLRGFRMGILSCLPFFITSNV
jgi:hypothetical protein